MVTSRVRAVAAAAALLALVLLVGTAAYLATEEDPPPPAPTSTTTSTTLSLDEIAEIIAGPLQADLRVAVTPDEARCVARAVVEVVPVEQLATLEADPAPLAALSEDQRSRLLRGVVTCVPQASAEALLGDPTSTTADAGLPGQG